MKKTYINPDMQVIKIQTMQMLAASTKVDMQSGEATEWGGRENDADWDD